MTHLRGFPLPRSRGQTRKVGWGSGPGGTSVTSFFVSSSSILGSGVVPSSDGITLVRLRGTCLIHLSAATAVTDGFGGAIGVAVVTDRAFAAGIGSIPTPLTSDGFDGWLWHSFFEVHAGVSADITGPYATQRFDVDSKAMRKLTVGQTICAVIEIVEDPTAVLDVYFNSRTLSKLP